MLNKHTVGHSTTNGGATRSSIDSLHHNTQQQQQHQHLHLQVNQQQHHPNLNLALQNQQTNYTPQSDNNFSNNRQHQQSSEQHLLRQSRQQHLSPNDALSVGINLEQYISKRNERERSRVRNVNDAFDNLKNSLPLEAEKLTKRMSKVEILRTAISYIRNLEGVLGYEQQNNIGMGRQHQYDNNNYNYNYNYNYNNSQLHMQTQQQRTTAINELSSLLLAATSVNPASPSTIATSTSASSSASSPAPSAGEQQVAGYYLEQQLGSPGDLMCRLQLERTNSCYTIADDQHSASSAVASPDHVYDIQQQRQEQPVMYQNYLGINNTQTSNQHNQQQQQQQLNEQQQQIMPQHHDRKYNCAATYSDQMRNTNINHRQFDQFQGY